MKATTKTATATTARGTIVDITVTAIGNVSKISLLINGENFEGRLDGNTFVSHKISKTVNIPIDAAICNIINVCEKDALTESENKEDRMTTVNQQKENRTNLEKYYRDRAEIERVLNNGF